MARTKLTGTVLEPEAHPAKLTKELTVAPATLTLADDENFPKLTPSGQKILYGSGDHVQPGIVHLGQPECPNCEADLTDMKPWYTASGVVPVWNCCYSLCSTDVGHHPCLDEDQCPDCERCTDHCTCDRCVDCGDVTDESCSDCDCCPSCCECNYCEDCGNPEDRCECMGTMKVAPWEARGDYVRIGVRTNTQIDFYDFDPLMAMADFYLLEYLTLLPGGDWSDYYVAAATYADEARAMQRRLVQTFDEVFIEYVDMVVGGEVRHHRCMGELSRDRNVAWGEWKYLREQLGLDILKDAAVMFEDMGGRNGYGGEPWAAAARIVHGRLSGRIDPRTFVDRVFSMQHNGGSLLNKVSWATRTRSRHDVEWMAHVGNAHAATVPDLSTLVNEASAEVEDLMRRSWCSRNRLLSSLNMPLELLPRHTLLDDGLTEMRERTTPNYAQENS